MSSPHDERLPAGCKVAIVSGGREYERDSIAKSTQDCADAIAELGYISRVFVPGGTFLPDLASFRPVTCLLIDPYFVSDSDGQLMDVRPLLVDLRIPFTGSDAAAATICRDKVLSKVRMTAVGLRVAAHRLITPETSDEEMARTVDTTPLPAVVKPCFEGSGVGVTFCDTRATLVNDTKRCRAEFGTVLVEEYIDGRDATVTVIGESATAYALAPAEIDLGAGRITDSRRAPIDGCPFR